MKVYEYYRNNKKGPQIKIGNDQLTESGFVPGTEYEIIYEKGKLILQLIKNTIKLPIAKDKI